MDNIFTLQKDVRVKHLLLLLAQTFGENALHFTPSEEDSQAIRLLKPGDNTLSIYVYTYGQDNDNYGVHLEYPDLKETSLNNTLDIYENVSYEALCRLIESHLDCPAINKRF